MRKLINSFFKGFKKAYETPTLNFISDSEIFWCRYCKFIW